MAIEDVAVAVAALLHQVGLVEIAAVDAGGLRRNEVEGRHGEVLSEGVAGEVELGKGVLLSEHALCLAAQIYARCAVETEGIEIVVESIRPQPQTVGDKGGVAGITHRLHQRLLSVTFLGRAVDGLAGDLRVTRAEYGGGLIHHVLFQRRGQRQNLEGRARLVGVV